MADHIAVYDSAMDPVLWRTIVEKFDECGKAAPGMTGSGRLDLDRKNSHDLTITNYPEWRPLLQQVTELTSRYLLDYF